MHSIQNSFLLPIPQRYDIACNVKVRIYAKCDVRMASLIFFFKFHLRSSDARLADVPVVVAVTAWLAALDGAALRPASAASERFAACARGENNMHSTTESKREK